MHCAEIVARVCADKVAKVLIRFVNHGESQSEDNAFETSSSLDIICGNSKCKCCTLAAGISYS